MEERRQVIRNLMDHPTYFTLQPYERLHLIHKVESGICLSTVFFWLKLLNWLKTGKLE